MVANIEKKTVYAIISFDYACNVAKSRPADRDPLKGCAKFQFDKKSKMTILFEVDLNHTIENISPDIEAILGYDPQEVIGKSLCNFVILSDLPNVDRALESVVSDEKTEQLIARVKSKDGKTITLKVKLLPIIAKRKVIGIQGILHVSCFPKE